MDLQHVPYRGAPPAVLGVVNGEVTMGFFNAPTVLGQIASGKLKALAVTAKDRIATLPDVPTMIEAGVADFMVATWLGFAVPAHRSFRASMPRSTDRSPRSAINSTVFAPLAIIIMYLSKFVATWG